MKAATCLVHAFEKCADGEAIDHNVLLLMAGDVGSTCATEDVYSTHFE